MIDCLRGDANWQEPPPLPVPPPARIGADLADVQGQPLARRAIEIAAAGGHHVLLIGPPGAGKTMIAKTMPGLLPRLSGDDALEVTTVHSAAGITLPPGGLVRTPPFRAPHHTSSTVALVGGGTRQMRPGEISCAHGGVLVPRRARRVPHDGARCAAPATRGGHGACRPCLRQRCVSGALRVSSAQPTPARAAKPRPPTASAAVRPWLVPATPGGCRARCSTASTCGCTCSVPAPRHCSPPSGASRAPPSPLASLGHAPSPGPEASTRTWPSTAPHSRAWRLSTPTRSRCCSDAVDDGRLSARGVHRVRCVARTIADLEGIEGELRPRHVAAALALRAEVFAEAARLGEAS